MSSVPDTSATDVHVTAIVISYQPELPRLRTLCERLRSQCRFIIVDNGSEASVIDSLADCVGDEGQVLPMNDNVGIAAAQNAGAAAAMQDSDTRPEFLLFLDQDSLPDEDFVRVLKEEYLALRERDPQIGAIGPALIDVRNGQLEPLHHESFGFYWKRRLNSNDLGGNYKVAGINGSGTFLECETFASVGGFREDLFIDHVDTEWSMRARHRGLRLYITTKASLRHEMGRGLEQFWLFGDRSFPSRAPLRHYYLFRNNVFLLSQPQMSKTWKFWSVVKLAFTFCYFGIFSPDRGEQRAMMRDGIRDGRGGKLGKFGEAAG